MSLDVSLRFALTGLTASQRGLDVVSRNIANADTEGYTRKTLTQYNEIINGYGFGVRTGNIERVLDKALQRELLTRDSQAARHSAVESYLLKMDAVQGRPDSELSVGNLVKELHNGFVGLLDQPDSLTLQRQVLDQADTLARRLNQVSDTVNTLRNQAQAEINDLIGQVNHHLSRIDDLNRSLTKATLAGETAPDLEDKRDQSLRELAKLVDISYFRTGTGEIKINAANGQPLLDSSFQPFSTSPATLNASSYYEAGNPASPIPPILLGGTTDMTPFLTGGRLGGLIELRDEILPTMQAELDGLAVTMARRFEDAGLTLFTDSTGTVPGGYVAPPAALAYVGFASSIRVAAAIQADPSILRDGDAGQPGGATYPGYRDQLQAVVDDVFGTPASAALDFPTADLGPGPRTLSTRLMAGATLAAYANEMVTANGMLRAETTRQLDAAEAIRDRFQEHLGNESGVNIDQEIGLLIQLQRSYSSSARVITTNREMFAELLQAV